MAKLNEYLGSIISGITDARVMADLQTVKVAREYNKHELLKHFVVPHLRISDIELTIPVAIEEVTEKDIPVYEPIDNRAFQAVAYREVVNSMGLKSLPADKSNELQKEISRRTKDLEEQLRIHNNLDYLKSFASEIAGISVKVADEVPRTRKYVAGSLNADSIAARLHDALAAEIKVSGSRKELDQLNVILEAHRLREYKHENLIFIKMKISEQGLEWSRAEGSDGKVTETLLHE